MYLFKGRVTEKERNLLSIGSLQMPTIARQSQEPRTWYHELVTERNPGLESSSPSFRCISKEAGLEGEVGLNFRHYEMDQGCLK